jgi:hypothetical protein
MGSVDADDMWVVAVMVVMMRNGFGESGFRLPLVEASIGLMGRFTRWCCGVDLWDGGGGGKAFHFKHEMLFRTNEAGRFLTSERFS